jgi:SHAQKYF class myb-like DNA-binding protein
MSTEHSNGQNDELERRITADSSINQQVQPQFRAPNNRTALARASSSGHNAASESVVPDLMEVYDALTQSSTPQTGAGPSQVSIAVEDHAKQGAYVVYPYIQGHQYPNPTPLPPVPGLVDGRNSNRRLTKSGSSDGSYTDSTGSKRKSYAGASRSTKRGKNEEPLKKKSATNDARWSKRFTWPDELHRDFVAAVFEVGLKHSSPSSIMEHMKPNPEITSERVKSHLQKYRLNRQKSRNEFMASYDSALDAFQRHPHDFESEGDHSFSCGEVAALLTHSIQAEASSDSTSKSTHPVVEQHSAQAARNPSSPAQDHDGVSTLCLPLLTEEESQSPLGQTFGYLVGMFQTLSLELEMKRRLQSPSNPHNLPATNPNLHGGATTLPSSQHQNPMAAAVATAASLHTDPSMLEVANAIPHAIVMGGPQGGILYSQGAGLYRLQSHGAQHEQQMPQYGQYQQAGIPPQPVHNPPQAMYPSQPAPHASVHNYHHAAAPFNHGSNTIYSAPANSYQHRESAVAPAQHQERAPKDSAVPCPLDNLDVSPGNAGHGTGFLQAQQESSIMKQEMKSQKAFQNKMRALKQVELNKYGGRQGSTSQSNVSHHSEEFYRESSAQPTHHLVTGESTGEVTDQATHEHHMSHSPLNHEEGIDHDFWNSGDVNDQLFDFLMD